MNKQSSGLFFLRHGQTTANAKLISSGGERDPDLTELGRAQVRAAVAVLHDLERMPGLIVLAPLKRTLHSAEIIIREAGLELELKHVPKFTERMLGGWNDQKSSITNPMLRAGKTPPGGESLDEFRNRVMSGFKEIAPLYPRWPLLVGSRGISRILLQHAKWSLERSFDFPNCGLLRVTLADPSEFKIAKVEHLNQLREIA